MKKKSAKRLNDKKLRLASKKKWLGVCGGVAKYLGIDVVVVRVVFIVFTVLSGFFPGLLIYILSAWVMSEIE